MPNCLVKKGYWVDLFLTKLLITDIKIYNTILNDIPAYLKITTLKIQLIIKINLNSFPLKLKVLNLSASNGNSATNK